jgi:hypothetical protein
MLLLYLLSTKSNTSSDVTEDVFGYRPHQTYLPSVVLLQVLVSNGTRLAPKRHPTRPTVQFASLFHRALHPNQEPGAHGPRKTLEEADNKATHTMKFDRLGYSLV